MMLSDFLESAHIMTKTTAPDGYGGEVETWVQGTEIRAFFSRKSNTEARIAEQNSLKTLWSILHADTVDLRQNDLVKRDSMGVIYRITSNSGDMTPPNGSEIKYKQVFAEVISV